MKKITTENSVSYILTRKNIFFSFIGLVGGLSLLCMVAHRKGYRIVVLLVSVIVIVPTFLGTKISSIIIDKNKKVVSICINYLFKNYTYFFSVENIRMISTHEVGRYYSRGSLEIYEKDILVLSIKPSILFSETTMNDVLDEINKIKNNNNVNT